jgi:signal transduction histidine kinase
VDVRDLLLAITREMAVAGDVDALLQTMVEAALRIVPAAGKCVIHLLDPTGRRLVPRVCHQPSVGKGESAGIAANQGVAGRALRERATIRVDDISQSPDFVPLRSGPELRSLLVTPLFVSDILLGTLSLSSHHTHAFTQVDCEHMRTLAAQASVAIRQTNLLHEAVAERQRSDAIIESISDGLIILDGERRIVRVNPALRRMLELSDGELHLPCSLDSAADCPARLGALLAQGKEGSDGPAEKQLPLPSGARVSLKVVSSPLATPAAGEVIVVHDVTAERQAAEARALFTSQVSHELRTPLQHIMGFIGLISDIDDLPRENRLRFFGHIQDEINNLSRLVDDLGELSRIETGRFSVRLEPVQLDELVADAVSKITPRAQILKLSLTLGALPENVLINTDPLRLRQVLCNLVENALKYVPAGGSIRVSLEATEREVEVSVADTGPGIAPELLARVFDRFYQVNADGRRTGGMGLGLYISREIISALGGSIWAESQVGVGSTFRFRLPRT